MDNQPASKGFAPYNQIKAVYQYFVQNKPRLFTEQPIAEYMCIYTLKQDCCGNYRLSVYQYGIP